MRRYLFVYLIAVVVGMAGYSPSPAEARDDEHWEFRVKQRDARIAFTEKQRKEREEYFLESKKIRHPKERQAFRERNRLRLLAEKKALIEKQHEERMQFFEDRMYRNPYMDEGEISDIIMRYNDNYYDRVTSEDRILYWHEDTYKLMDIASNSTLTQKDRAETVEKMFKPKRKKIYYDFQREWLRPKY